MSQLQVSIVTPTYERAETLPRLYESLLAQGIRDFEWIVIDDGSNDGTGDLVAGWSKEAPFSIEYAWQQNGGKHVAVNCGIERATAPYCAVMDSDDWYAENALERMLATWASIPKERRNEFANVEGLCAAPGGELLGDRFPAEVFDSDAFEIEFLHGVRGDTVGMYRREVLAAFPFPEDLGWHVRPGLVWNRIAARWSSRFVNEVWGYKEYLAGGLTERGDELRVRLTRAQLAYWTEFAAMPRRMSLGVRLRANANSVRYSLWERVSLRRALAESARPAWALAGLPFGILLYLRDRWRAGHSGEVER